jgi:hypothetical protein
MALKKLCSGCFKPIDYGSIRCPECEQKYKDNKAKSSKAYDTQVRKLRDSKYNNFYHSSDWIKTARLCRIKYKGLDIYNYYILGSIEYGNICHHIKPLKDDGWNDRFNLDGLIYLTNDNHSLIHSLYEKDYKGTKQMLFDLINKWNENDLNAFCEKYT